MYATLNSDVQQIMVAAVKFFLTGCEYTEEEEDDDSGDSEVMKC